MTKKPLGPEGARFKKANWNPQDSSAKRTYIDEHKALQQRLSELEKVQGFTIETVSLTRDMVSGKGPFVIKYLEPSGAAFEYEALSGNDAKVKAHFAQAIRAALKGVPNGQAVRVPVPDLGEGVPGAKIQPWPRAEGSTVEIDDVIAVLETDKASVEIVAPIKGTLSRYLLPANAQVAVGVEIVEITPLVMSDMSISDWPFCSSLPTVALIQSPSGDKFLAMPDEGILEHLQPDLSRVEIGDPLFAVKMTEHHFFRWENGRELYEEALLDEAQRLASATNVTPDQIAALNAKIASLDKAKAEQTAAHDRALNEVRERNKKLAQDIKDQDKKYAPFKRQEEKSGCLLIGGLVGWVAAIGLYIYSDLPIPFVGGSEENPSYVCATRLLAQNNLVATPDPNFVLLSGERLAAYQDSWYRFDDPIIAPSDDIEITSVRLTNDSPSGAVLNIELMNRSDSPIGDFAGAVEFAEIGSSACEHRGFDKGPDPFGRIIQPGTSGSVLIRLPNLYTPGSDEEAVVWFHYQPQSQTAREGNGGSAAQGALEGAMEASGR